jgi:hypothetical protein
MDRLPTFTRLAPAACAALSLLAAGGSSARADEALLRNGRTLNVSGYRLEGDRVVLQMEGGGEIALLSHQVLAIRRGVGGSAAPPLEGPSSAPAVGADAGPGLPPAAPAGSAAPSIGLDGPIEIPPGAVFDRVALRELATRVARRHRVDEALVLAVVEVESRYDAFAVSPRGAMGLMQLMPKTVARFAVRNAFDPVDNLDGGVRYLKELLQRYSGEVRLALAAYNAGEEAVERFNGIPPYRETEQYVVRVMRTASRGAFARTSG